MSDRYAVVGNPIAHSKSPQIHMAFAAQTGQDLCYERLLAPLDGFEATVEAFARDGGRGCNVTMPFKQQAFALCATCCAAGGARRRREHAEPHATAAGTATTPMARASCGT